MKTIVAYKSKTGYTKKYAEWLAKELKCDIKENATLSDIIDYDAIICGGGLYAGSVRGFKLITKNYDKLKDKKLVVFAVGSSPGHQHEIEKVWAKILTDEQKGNIKAFYLRGGFDYSKLSVGDKLLMSMLKKMLKKQENPDEDTKGLLDAYDNPVDFTDKDNIMPIIEYIK